MPYPSTVNQTRERGFGFRPDAGREEWMRARWIRLARCRSALASDDDASSPELCASDWVRMRNLSPELARAHSRRKGIQARRLHVEEGCLWRASVAADADERRAAQDSDRRHAAGFADSYREHGRH